jgi:hypothetical protein
MIIISIELGYSWLLCLADPTQQLLRHVEHLDEDRDGAAVDLRACQHPLPPNSAHAPCSGLG